MANHNCTVNIALGPGTTSPGPYTVQVKKCSELTYTPVPGSPFNLNNFPVSFNICLLLGINEGSCFEWQVIDTVSGCLCEGSENIPIDPTPTPSVTLTPGLSPSVTASNTVTPSVTLTPSLSPSVTASNTVTPSVTPSVTSTSVTPSITPTNTVTPTNTLTPGLTPSQITCGFSCIVTCTGEETGDILYLSGLTTHVVYSTWNNTRFLNENGQVQTGASGLFNEGDFIEGTVYTPYYASSGRPEVINGNRAPLKDNQFLVISQQEFENHWFTKYIQGYLGSDSNNFLRIPRYTTFNQPLTYEVYDFSIIPNPGLQPQVTYDDEFKLLIEVTQDVINNFSNNEVISVVTNYGERWVEWMESIGVNATYDISLSNGNTIWDTTNFGPGGPTGVHNYYYSLGGLKNATGYDAAVGIYYTTGSLNGIATGGLRVSQTRFPNSPNNNDTLEYFRTTFIHEIGHSIGLAHSFDCNSYEYFYESIGVDTPTLDGFNRQYLFTNQSFAGVCVNAYNGFVQPYSGDTDGNMSAMSYKERRGYEHTGIAGMARQLDLNRVPNEWYYNCSAGLTSTQFGLNNNNLPSAEIIYNKFTEGNEFNNDVISVTIEMTLETNISGNVEIYLTDVDNDYLVDTVNPNGDTINFSETVQIVNVGNIWDLNNQEKFGVKISKGGGYYTVVSDQSLKLTFNTNSSNTEKQPANMLTEKTNNNWGLELDFDKNDCSQYATLGEAEVQKQFNRIFYNTLGS